MAKIRKDSQGLYVIAGGYVSRPGAVGGYSHAYRMDSGNLKENDEIKARHLAGSPLTKISLPDGKTTYWFHEGNERNYYLHETDLTPENFDQKGIRCYE